MGFILVNRDAEALCHTSVSLPKKDIDWLNEICAPLWHQREHSVQIDGSKGEKGRKAS
jgi:hypothetical protein